MRAIFTFLIVFFLVQVTTSKSQELQILNEEEGDMDVSDTTLDYTGPDSLDTFTIIADLKVKNNGDKTLQVKIKKYYIDIVDGTSNDFCWAGTCLNASVMESPTAVSMAPGESADDFDAHYHCLGNPGTSTVMYTVFNENNPSDSVSVTINYTAESTSIGDHTADLFSGNLYPNPAHSRTALDYDLPAGTELKFVIYDILGKEIKNYTCHNKGTLSIPLSDLRKGTYICHYMIDGEINYTQKLIVQ
ncbi:MAG: T9SS type A sorting domain-containing protein [Bacteroidota bacterium]